MNGLDFLEKMNDIDDNLIDEAARKWSAPEKAAKPKPWVYITAGVAAVAAVILLVIGLNAGGGRVPDGNGTALVSAGETETSTEAKTTKPTETTPSATTAESAAPAGSNAVTDSTASEDHGESDDDNNTPAPAEPEPDTDSYDEDNAPANPEYRVMYIASFVDDAFSEDEDAYPASEDTVAFWEDEAHTYYISQERLSQTFVTYENGDVEDLVTALENGHIEISDLDTFGVPYYYS